MKKKTAIVVSLICAFALCLSALPGCSRDTGGKEIVLADITASPPQGTEETKTYSSKTLVSEEDAGMVQLACPADGGTYAICASVNAEAEYVLGLYFVGQTSEIKEISDDWLKGSGVTAMCAAEGGGLWLVRSTQITADKMEYELCTLKHEKYAPFLNIDVRDNSAITGVCAAKGRVFVSQTDYQGESVVTAYSLIGEKEYELDIGASYNLISDGNSLYIGKRSRDSTALSICSFDPESKKITELASFDSGSLLSCTSRKLYIGDATGAFEYDAGSGNARRLFQWASYGLSGVGVSLWSDGCGGFIACGREGVKALTLDAVNARKQITLAVNSPPGMYSSAVIAFNDSNTEYEVIIKDYSSYSDPQQMLNVDIIAGDRPDIIDAASFSGEIITPGTMTDLLKYINSDAELSEDDFLAGPLKAMMTDEGKLLAIAPIFYVSTFVCRTGTVEIKNYDGVIHSLSRMGTPEAAFAGTCSRDTFLQLAFCCGGVEKYSREEIVAILSYAAELPDIEDYSAQAENLASGKQHLMHNTLGSGMHLMSTVLNFFGSMNIEDLTVLGLPFREGTGVVIPAMYLAIPSNADNADGAWAFLKSLLMEGGPAENEYPLMKARYEATKAADKENIKRGLRTYYVVNGQEIEYVFDSVDFYELSDTLLQGVNGVYDADATAIGIVNEACAALFAGNKTVEAATDEILSRLNIYFSEQK